VGRNEQHVVHVVVGEPGLVLVVRRGGREKGRLEADLLDGWDQVSHRVFGAVAVVHVEVDDGDLGDAAATPHAARVRGAHGWKRPQSQHKKWEKKNGGGEGEGGLA
jgi:hypothetical protein